MKSSLKAVTALYALLLSTPALASDLSEIRHALCPFHAAKAARLLSPALLEDLSEAELLGQLDLEKRYGPCESVHEVRPGHYAFELRDATVDGDLRISHKKLEDFNFAEARFRGDDFAKLEASVRKLKERAGLWVEKNGAKVLGVNEDGALNVARAFHLFVIRALLDAEKERDVKATDLVTLEGKARTVSFGLLHHWAPGTKLTLDSLKNLVAVESDATAVDLLIGALGRERIEKQGAHLAPLLTYREMARLSESVAAGHAPASREAAMKALAALPDADGIVDFPDERFDLVGTVGWFASAKELCTQARALRDEPALAHAYRDLRDQDSRKPGETVELYSDVRDPGVGQSTLLFKQGSDELCVSLTLNSDGPLDERLLTDIMGRAESLLLKK